ncbi:MAG TPA: hypothetical protein VGO00_15965 [Kofleriaceae bacterium]|nr:hypothetical protein [Kofleriaceae bacterium]
MVPERAFIGRDVRVEISGDATHWVDGTRVSFGDGATVNSLVVASPTSLFAEVSIADAATAGLTDVTVTGSDGTLVLKAGLDIEPPLHLVTTGTLAQGSIIGLRVMNLDIENPFDTTSTTFGGVFPNLDIQPPPGTTLQTIDDGSAFELDATLTIDIDAQPGELVINSGPRGHTIRLSAGTLAVAPRTAIPLTPNTLTAGGPLDRSETVLYEFTPAATPSVTLADVSTGGFLLLPASGHFEDAFTTSGTIGSFVEFDPVSLLTDKYYLIYGDNGFATDTYQVQVGAQSLAQTLETANANDTGATAQPIQLPAIFANGTLSSTHDADFVTFPIAAADIGKTVRVMTQGDAATVIDVFADEAATISLGESAGGSFDDFTSMPIPDGTTAIYVKFSSTGELDSDLSDYLAAILLNHER